MGSIGSINRFTSCKATATSPARQPFTLSNGIKVLCDTRTDGGDWFIIQRRTKGDVDFYRGWTEYVAGFGDIDGDYWLGLQDIHTLCPTAKPCTLRVDVKDDQYNNGSLLSAQYTDFSLSGFTDNYRLTIGLYNGTVSDSLRYHNKQPFSTFDRDNDDTDYNCAFHVHGGWWYKSCFQSNLNGPWADRGNGDGRMMGWGPSWNTGYYHYLHATYSEMKVRVQS